MHGGSSFSQVLCRSLGLLSAWRYLAGNGVTQGVSASDVGKMSATRIEVIASSTHSFTDPI
jgi:hypothetical protein